MAEEQIQQTTETTQAPPVEYDAGDVTDAQLIAAAQEAGGADAVLAEQAIAEGKPPPAPAAAPPAAEEPKILGIMRQREKAMQEREAAVDYAAQRRQQAEEEAAKILADARARAATDYESDLAARRAKFRASPGAAIRELGTPDEIVDAVTREGTAEWRAIREATERAERAEQAARGIDTVKADFDAFKNQVASERLAEQRFHVERAFITEHASPEKAPTLHQIAASIPNIPGAVRGPAAVIAWGHAVAAEWTRAGIPFAHGDVAEYLEHQARTGNLGAGAVSPQPPKVSGTSGAPQVRANGSRTLSAASGSERRAAPKPIEEMSPDEERAALIEAAAEARRTAGG